MNRIQSLFGKKQNNILSVYFTAGFPTLDSTKPIIDALSQEGIDMIEIGVPFSDPMADGPAIQHSSTVALRNGITLPILLEQVKEARKSVADVPFILMGYLNPILQYGIENIFIKCKEAGIDGMIIPDLPFEEYMNVYKPLCDKYDIPMIMLITPETSEERIKLIDENCDGFIYMVSSASTTGTKEKFNDEQTAYFKKINGMNLNHRRLIGFGISNKTTMTQACENASGAIIGSFFIKCLEAHPEDFLAAVKQLKKAIGI